MHHLTRALLLLFAFIIIQGCGDDTNKTQAPIKSFETVQRAVVANCPPDSCNVGIQACDGGDGLLECFESAEFPPGCGEFEAIDGDCHDLQCPTESCIVGTYVCSGNGLVECVQHGHWPEGCGQPKNVGGSCSDLCYRGECINTDDIPFPTPLADPNNPKLSLFYQANVEFRPSYRGAVVVPYEAFIAGLNEDDDVTMATNALLNSGAQMVMDANDHNILGGYAELEGVEERVSADIFIVALDPTLSSGATFVPGGDSHVEIKSYFIAVMPGLEVPTSWVGHNFTMLGRGQIGIPSQDCCQGSQPERSCGFGGPFTGVLPAVGPDCLMNADCPFFHESDLADIIEQDPYTMPYRTGGGARSEPDLSGRSRTNVIRGNGMPAIYMYSSMNYEENLAAFEHHTPTLDDSGLFVTAYHAPLHCEQCNIALCPTDPPLDPTFTPVNVTNECGVPVNGTNEIPKHCQQMMPTSTAGLSCAGIINGMKREFDPDGVCGGLGSMGGTSILGGTSASSGGNCVGPDVPNYCKWADSDECTCDSDCQRDRQNFMNEFYGCGGLLERSAGPNVTCIDGGFCKSDGGGREVCFQCNDNGDCRTEVFSSLFDSRYASGKTDSAEEAKTEDNSVDNSCPACQSATTPGCVCFGDTHIHSPNSPNTSEKQKVDVPNPPEPEEDSDDQQDDGTEIESLSLDSVPTPPSAQPVAQDDSEGTEQETTTEENARPLLGRLLDILQSFGGNGNNNKNVHNSNKQSNTAEHFAAAEPENSTTLTSDGIGGSGHSNGGCTNCGGKGEDDTSGGNKPPTAKGADPVILSSGSLLVEHKDLSFDGPVHPLTFERYYDSRSEDRSILGSNWSHNYDYRVVPIKPGNYPEWAPSYCIAYAPTTTCAMVHYPGGAHRLFVKSPGDPNSLFYPQAGSADTLQMNSRTWHLRAPDGHVRVFNQYGYIVSDRDRFGNGNTIEYEFTPTFQLQQRYCHTTSNFVVREALPLDPMPKLLLPGSIDKRVCRTLATMHGDKQPAMVHVKGFDPTFDNRPTLQLPGDDANQIANLNESLTNRWPYDSDAYSYVQTILEVGALPSLPTGDRKLRPKLVRDNLGRELTFQYHDDPSDLTTYGLLEKVHGPDSITSVTYSYQRPGSYPERLQESFLTQVDRNDGNGTLEAGLEAGFERTIEYTYSWPGVGFGDYTTSAQSVYDAYLAYFSTFTGCKWDDLSAVVCMPQASFSQGSAITSVAVCDANGSLHDSGGLAFPGGNISGSGGGCIKGGYHYSEESPCFLATQEEHRYVSSIADNIVQIVRDNVVEVSSRYELNPNDPSFDRVTVQRYGGMANADYGPYAQAGHTSNGWEVDYPEFTIEYIQTQPNASNGLTDITDTELPSALTNRYPLETSQTNWKPVDGCIATDSCDGEPAAGSGRSVYVATCGANYEMTNYFDSSNEVVKSLCDPNAFTKESLLLPGTFQTYDYYTLPADTTSYTQIYRSRLTCRQLAAAHLGDPTHNGLMKIKDQQDWLFASDQREQIESDSRRICSWAHLTDRDGNEQYVGMNFRGQTLVFAEVTSQGTFVTESIYNADGLLAESRDTTLSTEAWDGTRGHTVYTYDELQPEGNGGLNKWKLLWWARRFNLASVKVYPDTSASVPDTLVHEWDPVSGTFVGEEVEYFETRQTYEPLFNQPHIITSSVKTAQNAQVRDLQLVYYTFDYQEFNPTTDDAFYEALNAAQSWGWRIPGNKRRPTDPEDEDYASEMADNIEWIESVLVPMPFEGTDINGDGILGFSNYGPAKSMSIRGFPIQMTVKNLEVTDPQAPLWERQQTVSLQPAPQGRPARVETSSGAVTTFRYYPLSSVEAYGASPLTEDTFSSSKNAGFLARVAHKRFNHEYEEQDAGSFDAPVHDQVCSELKGPYQWMLPDGCGSGAATELANLGIPQEVRDELLHAADKTSPGARPWLITTMRYFGTGELKEVLQDGLRTSFVKDLDGRVLEITDPQGSVTTITRNARGEALEVTVEEDPGTGLQVAGRTHYQRDLEGRVLSMCEDVQDGGCQNNLNFTSLLPFNAARDTQDPDYLLTTYRYTPEGKLYKAMDPSGVETTWTYDERNLLIARQTEAGGGEEDRRVEYVHDTLGRVIEAKNGTSTTRSQSGAYDSTYVYDGLGQLKTMTDVYGVNWQYAWSAEGQLSATKQDSTPYGITSGADTATAAHELLVAYDGFGRRVQTRLHDEILNTLDYDRHGFLRHKETRPASASAGSGQHAWMTYDGMGELVWMLDEQGNQSFVVSNPNDLTLVSGTIRVDSETASTTPVYLTTSSRTTYDTGGHPWISETFGHNGEEQQSEYIYSAMGHLLSSTNPENESTTFTRNLLGWPEYITEPSTSGNLSSVQESMVYNARGQALQIHEVGEPGGTTTFTYNNFGQRLTRTLPMDPTFTFDEYSYDGYGRIATYKRRFSNTSSEDLSWSYNTLAGGQRNVKIHWNNSPVLSQGSLMRSAKFDALGRLIETNEYQHALADALGTTTMRKVQREYQHDALGRVTSQIQRIWDDSTLESNYTVTSTFALDTQERFKRTLDYPSGTSWEYHSDALGRLDEMVQTSVGGGATGDQIDFRWKGNLYTGRAQVYNSGANTPDPLRELRQYDGLGRRTNIAYAAVDLDSNGDPINSTWGDTYCLGSWDSACQGDLLDIALKYDVMGRLVSSRKTYGHAIDDGMSSVVPLAAHRKQWRGYDYSARGFLQTEWHNDNVTDAQHDTLINHQVTTHEVDALVSAPPGGSGTKWEWARESGAGDLISVHEAGNTSNSRWKHTNASATITGARDAGHLLDTVIIDGGDTHTISHDGRGRIIDDGTYTYTYDPFDRIVTTTASGTSSLTESYLYDASGRLVEVEDHTTSEQRVFVYDGVQMIANYADGILDWEASWGPGLDHLLQWRHVGAAGGPKNYLPLRDHRNNIVGLWDADAVELVGLADYTAMGRVKLVNQDETAGCDEESPGHNVCAPLSGVFPFGFNSAWRSRATGLVSMRHRWYSPKLGQFTSHDPLEYIDSKNMYAFAAFDPVNQWDPWGLSSGGMADPAPNYSRVDEARNDTKQHEIMAEKQFEWLKERNYSSHGLPSSEKFSFQRKSNKHWRRGWGLAILGTLWFNSLPGINLRRLLSGRIGRNEKVLVNPNLYRRRKFRNVIGINEKGKPLYENPNADSIEKYENSMADEILSKTRIDLLNNKDVDNKVIKSKRELTPEGFQLKKGMGRHTLKGTGVVTISEETDKMVRGTININYNVFDPYDWNEKGVTVFPGGIVMFDDWMKASLLERGFEPSYNLEVDYNREVSFELNKTTGELNYSVGDATSDFNSRRKTKIVGQ